MIRLEVRGGSRGCSSSTPPDSDNAGSLDMSILTPAGEAAMALVWVSRRPPAPGIISLLLRGEVGTWTTGGQLG